MGPLGIIVLIVLVDLLGFTIVMPLLGPFGAHYGFSDWQIGLLFSSYQVAQLVAVGVCVWKKSMRNGKLIEIRSEAVLAVSWARPQDRPAVARTIGMPEIISAYVTGGDRGKYHRRRIELFGCTENKEAT